MSTTPQQRPRGRRRRGDFNTPETQDRSCPYCGRLFKRWEHLDRHVRSHTREKPFVCHCGASFSRRDLLTRHQRLAMHPPPLLHPIHVPSIPTTPSIPIHQQSHHPHSSQSQGHFHSPQDSNNNNNNNNNGIVPVAVAPPPQLHHEPPPSFVEQTLSQPSFLSHDYHNAIEGSGDIEGLDPFREFANFLDGVGLSADWSPYFQEEPAHHEHVPAEASRPETPEDGHDGAERPGTPFNCWLPSAPGMNNEYDGAEASSRGHQRSVNANPLRVSDEQRAKLLSDLQCFENVLDNNFALPSRHTLTRYITSYFSGFHLHMPFIHLPTWNLAEAPLELVLGVATVGAQYCFEHKMSERLFKAGKSVLLTRLTMYASKVGSRTAAVLNLGVGPSLGSSVGNCPGPWEPIDSVRALIALMGFATWEKKPEFVQEAFTLSNLLVQVLRDIGTNEEQHIRTTALDTEEHHSSSSSTSAAWRAWVHEESIRRAKLIAFTFLHTHSIAYNTYPILRSNEIKLRLPCCTSKWNASSPNQWIRATKESPQEQLNYQDAISSLLRCESSSSPPSPSPAAAGSNNNPPDLSSPSSSPSPTTTTTAPTSTSTSSTPIKPLSPLPTPLGNYVLLHGLIQRIHIIRDLSLSLASSSSSHPPPPPSSSSSSPPGLPPDEVSSLDRALRSWTLGWQQALESSLDPNNENGPIPFTSSSLLGLAYVRLYLDLGPHRSLASRDPGLIAASLFGEGNGGKNKLGISGSREEVGTGNGNGKGGGGGGVISALLYAAHALSIPVRLGVDRVARSQAFFWSVRHSLSGLECAVLLSKWLQSLDDAIVTGGGEEEGGKEKGNEKTKTKKKKKKRLMSGERRILHWVRCIVREAYDAIDFDDEGEGGEGNAMNCSPWELGLAVLGIWARLFQQNTQWPFVNVIGEGLEGYRKLLMEKGPSNGG